MSNLPIRDSDVFLNHFLDTRADLDSPGDAEILLNNSNYISDGSRTNRTSDRRESILEKCFSCGQHYNRRSDNDFTFQKN